MVDFFGMRLSNHRISVKAGYLMLIVSEHYLYHGLSNYYRQRKVFGYLAVDKDLILAQLSEQPSWNRQVSSCYPWKKNIFWGR